VADALIREMDWYDRYLERSLSDRAANPSPGNKAGPRRPAPREPVRMTVVALDANSSPPGTTYCLMTWSGLG
jgi:hypothetical protein